MSLTAEDLQAISDLMDEKLKPIKEDIEEIKEHAEITRETTNDIVEWIDTYWRDKDRPFPVDSKYVG